MSDRNPLECRFPDICTAVSKGGEPFTLEEWFLIHPGLTPAERYDLVRRFGRD